MTGDQAMERLRRLCGRSERSRGQAEALLLRWIAAERAGEKTAEEGRKREKTGRPVAREGTVRPLSEDDIPRILQTLESERFIDDIRFAGAYVRDKLRFNGWGPRKIRYGLRMLKVAPETIEEALMQAEIFDSGETELSGLRRSGKAGTSVSGEYAGENRSVQEEALFRLVKNKWNSLRGEKSPEIRRAKVLRFALGRGFEYDAAVRMLERICRGEGEDGP